MTDPDAETTQYNVTVKTGNVKSAGTDANVYLVIFGKNGETAKTHLHKNTDEHWNKFERGTTDNFEVTDRNVGEITHIKISHDGSGIGCGWFLDEILIVDNSNGQNYMFPCNRWLDINEDDGKIERELMPLADIENALNTTIQSTKSAKSVIQAELERLEKYLKEDQMAIIQPERKPHTPNTFNNLGPYTNTATPRKVVYLPDDDERLTIREIAASRETALDIPDPWIDWEMDNKLSPRGMTKPMIKSLPEKKHVQDRRNKEGSTHLPKFPCVKINHDAAPDKKMPWSEVPALRKLIKEKYSENAQEKIESDYIRTKQDFYRMELDRLDQVHPINKQNLRRTYFAYLQNTPGSKKALRECIQKLDESMGLSYMGLSREVKLTEEENTYDDQENTEKGKTLKTFSGFEAKKDCEALKNAMKGLGTKEQTIIDILGHRSVSQRMELLAAFKQIYSEDLRKELKSELSGSFLKVCLGLLEKPDEFDAKELNQAVKGLGTDEDTLIEIICTRTNSQIKAFTAAYKRLYHKELEDDITSDTSGHFKRLLVSLLQAKREETKEYDHTEAQADAQELYDAGEKNLGTDESKFIQILCSRSYDYLRAVFDEYSKLSEKTIEEAIESEMSGDIKNGMLTIVRCTGNEQKYFAKMLQKSMKGLGTNDDTLLRIVITRCEVDMIQIKEEFQKEFKQTLAQWIADDTSGDFMKLLLTLIGDEDKIEENK